MATIAEVARRRRQDFREILRLSRALDASQEAVEREIKRLVARKKSVPEVSDASRVLSLIGATGTALSAVGEKFKKLLVAWSNF